MCSTKGKIKTGKIKVKGTGNRGFKPGEDMQMESSQSQESDPLRAVKGGGGREYASVPLGRSGAGYGGKEQPERKTQLGS